MAILAARNLTYDFPGKRALDAVSFEAEPGSITALVGPNGAGKTTLLRCLAVLEHPLAGEVEIDGAKGAEAPRACHARLGYLADNFGLYDALTVRQCLAHHAAIHGMAAADRQRAQDWAIERMDLKDLLKQNAGTLSRGQRQRLGVAQAIVHYPKALLLDEPASGLDPEARWKLSSLLSQLARDGMTLIVSSHILAELQDYSTHVLILREGRVALHEPLSEAQRRVEGAQRASIRVELATADERLEPALKAFAGIAQIALHGRGATVFLSDDNAAKAGLLKHLVEAGLPVIGFHEDKSRVEDVYFSLVAGQDEAAAKTPDGRDAGAR